jgi:two-component system, NtrC family, sensor histidine kinase KinB
MATITTILICGDAGAGCEPLLRGAGARTECVPQADFVPGRLERGGVDAIVLSVGDAVDARRLVARDPAGRGAAIVLATAAEPSLADYRHAVAIGAVGVLHPDSAVSEAAVVIERIRERSDAARRDADERQRLRVQSEDLRRRCTQQAEKLHSSQQGFFVDLSRMMTIITNIMDGIVFVDGDGNVTLMNPAAEEMLGVRTFVALGKPLAALQGQPDLLRSLAQGHGAMAEHKEWSATVEVHLGDKDLVYIKVLTSRVLDYRGRTAGALTLFRDVTAEFKTDQLKNQYLSIVAHELRTPLTGIKTFATMMAKGRLGALGERQLRVCESIREQSIRLEHQIDKLINLGNLESADYGRDREPMSVADFAAGLLSPFEQPARDRSIGLSLVVDRPEENLFVDRSDLRRACQALIENAVKFARDGGSVSVSISADGSGLRFRVVDDGIGVDPRYHRRIFEKFFQVEDPLTRHHGGAGLGLFVARGIVEAHGSQIEVSSQLGKGADFSFLLPLYRPQASAGAGNEGAAVEVLSCKEPS